MAGANTSGANKNGIIISDVVSFLLILLFIYTAFSKILDFEQFKEQMNNQTLPHWTAQLLIYTLPGMEIITSLSLLFSATRIWGFYIAFFLMVLFTGYIALVLTNYFGRVPCSCGGVLKIMGWKTHFFFNLFFLLLTATGIYISYRERRIIGNKK